MGLQAETISYERKKVGMNSMETLMQAVFGWVRSLTGFFLFMSVMNHLMPEKTYASHIRLFSGLIFILLVLQPVVGNRDLEERIARYYESNLFRYETGELKENLLGIEKKQRAQIVDQYKQTLAREVSAFVLASGFQAEKCLVEINQDVDSGQFGKVMSVQVELSQTNHPDARQETSAKPVSVSGTEVQIQIPKIAIESGVQDKTGIDEKETNEERANKENANKANKGESNENEVNKNKSNKNEIKERAEGENKKETESDQRLGELRGRISSYCGVEEQYVEIRILEEKR